MTQKRGLGRGLGALIPGAGAAPAPEQPLRTRTHPRTEPEAGEKGASARPVDMFFSGEPSESEQERPQRSGASRRDLANDMARAAAERRGRGTSARRTKSSTEGEAASAEKASAKPASATKETAAKKEPAAKAEPASNAKAAPTKTTPTKTKAASTKATSASEASSAKAASGSKATPVAKASSAKTEADAEAKAAPAKSTDAAASSEKGAVNSKGAGRGKAADEKASTAAHSADEESPVVDIEAVELTPARADVSSAEQEGSPEEGATAAQRTAQDSTGDDAAVDDAAVNEAAEQNSAEAQQVEQELEGTQEEQESPELLPVPGTEFAEIPIHEIRENPRNPRTMFDEDELDELAYSLREVGVLQPIVVRPIRVTDEGESFELVMGERRWRAARRAGLASIPAIIRETSDDDLLRDALLENLHRSQLNPLEEAAAYQQLLEDFGCTQDELAERIGRSRPQVSNTLRLMRLPALVQRRLASGAISAGHARALLALEDSSLMEELAQRIVAEGLSVRAVERLVSRGTQPAPTRTPRRSTYDPHVVDITSRLSKSLEAPVRIDVGKRKGRITLEFTNLEDLERLVERIGLEMSDGISSQQD